MSLKVFTLLYVLAGHSLLASSNSNHQMRDEPVIYRHRLTATDFLRVAPSLSVPDEVKTQYGRKISRYTNSNLSPSDFKVRPLGNVFTMKNVAVDQELAVNEVDTKLNAALGYATNKKIKHGSAVAGDEKPKGFFFLAKSSFEEAGSESSKQEDGTSSDIDMTESLQISVTTDRSVFNVEDYYLSFTVDYEILALENRWSLFNLSSPRLLTLLKGLSPAILRVGGTTSSFTYFDVKPEHLTSAKLEPAPVVLRTEELENFVRATAESGNRFLVDLNSQSRQGVQWDPGNALAMMDFLESKGLGGNVDWELGNEPEYDSKPGQQKLTVTQIGEDFEILDRVMRSYQNLKGSRLVGPDCNEVAKGSFGYDVIQNLASAAGDFLTAITFHHYYFDGRQATYKDYIEPQRFSHLSNAILNVQSAVTGSNHSNLRIWIGETSDSYNSGTPSVSDRYVSGFLWLEKLGLAARMGVGVVMRQCLYCGYYGLIADYLQPNPDYWLSLIHKRLVGTRVLNAALNGTSFTADVGVAPPPTTRVYAHCTKLSSDGITPSYPLGSVTIFALNVSPNISKSLVLPPDWRKAPTDLYLLTPLKGDLLSQQVQLNDKILELISDTQLPQLSPKTLKPGQPFSLPPLTFGFLVVPQAKAKACL